MLLIEFNKWNSLPSHVVSASMLNCFRGWQSKSQKKFAFLGVKICPQGTNLLDRFFSTKLGVREGVPGPPLAPKFNNRGFRNKYDVSAYDNYSAKAYKTLLSIIYAIFEKNRMFIVWLLILMSIAIFSYMYETHVREPCKSLARIRAPEAYVRDS